MGRRKKAKSLFRFVEPHGPGFRGWYSDHGRKMWLPVRETEEEAHADAVRVRKDKTARRENKSKKPNFTLADGMDAVLIELQKAGRRDATKVWYRQQFATLCKKGWTDGAAPLARFDAEEIQWFIEQRQKQGVCASTINHHLRALNRIFVVAIKRGVLGDNPMEGVARPQVEDAEVRPFTRSEVVQMAEAIESSPELSVRRVDRVAEANLVRFLFAFGLRRTEMGELTSDCFDFKTGVLHVRHGRRRPRQVPICAEAENLAKFIAEMGRGPKGRITSGDNWKSRSEKVGRSLARWKGKFERSGDDELSELSERFHPHNVRHSLGAHMARCGVPEYQIALILGHKRGKQNVTARYMQGHGVDLLRAVEWAWRDPGGSGGLRRREGESLEQWEQRVGHLL